MFFSHHLKKWTLILKRLMKKRRKKKKKDEREASILVRHEQDNFGTMSSMKMLGQPRPEGAELLGSCKAMTQTLAQTLTRSPRALRAL